MSECLVFVFHAGVSGRGDISSDDGNGEQQELPEVAPVSSSCRRVVTGPAGLALAAVVGVVVLNVSRVALAKTQAVVACSVTLSIGCVLELAGGCGASSCGHWDARMLTRVDSAPSHAPSVLEAGHAAHSAVEIGVTWRQSGMLGRCSSECGSKIERRLLSDGVAH